jgi:hypothetical protein
MCIVGVRRRGRRRDLSREARLPGSAGSRYGDETRFAERPRQLSLFVFAADERRE